MNHVCLLVDINNDGLVDTWQGQIGATELAIPVNYTNLDDVVPMLETGNVVAMILFAREASQDVFNILELFKRNVGAISNFQAIVCDDPQPIFMTQVFEYGIENFFSTNGWVGQCSQFLNEIRDLLADNESPESKVIELNRSMLSGDQTKIIESEAQLKAMADYDFLAAYSQGTALQAVGRFNEAVDAFRKSQGLNKLFRPTVSGIGENLLVLGRTDEAIKIFKDMEKLNKRSVDRKASLASAYMEKGDVTTAKKYLLEAEALNPGHPRIAETKAQLLLSQGKIKEAFAQMDNLHDVGPFFAAKLNEMGIRLSQKGKGKSALALYKKAHRIVRVELKHKISLNAALACYRLKEFQMALKYLSRAEKEYGQPLEKAGKIRAAIKNQLAKAS